MKISSLILILFFNLNNLWAVEKIESGLYLKSGSMIELLDWDSELKVYTIQSVEFPGEGESEVSPENLAQSITEIKIKDLNRDPESILDNKYTLIKNLPVLTGKQLTERKKTLGKKTPANIKK